MSFTRATDRLSIAALPNAVSAHDLSELAWHLRDVHRLTGRPLNPLQVQSKLWHLYDGLFPPSAELVDEVMQGLSGIGISRFRVAFDHAVSLSDGAFVLRGRQGVGGLEALHEQIKSTLFIGKTNGALPFYRPHVTLLRDPRLVPIHELASPIEWEVTELVLVHSRLGKTGHHHVARLPLKARDGN